MSSVPPEEEANPFKTAGFTLLSVAFFAFVLLLNYVKALRWAGVMNAESIGYMMGGVMVSFLIGFLGVYAVRRVRGRQIAPASKALGITSIAVVFSIFGLAGEFAISSNGNDADVNRRAGVLLKEAAGKQPRTANAQWWDEPTRDFFRDIVDMNQRYSAEVSALDHSAIQNLYSTDSYAGVTHMKRVVSQLRAALAVDEKYASVDPVIKKMEDRVAAASASEKEKREFLKGMQGSLQQNLAPRNELIRKEEEWMKSTIALYEFLIAHTADYSIQDNKLYFRNKASREEFTTQQSRSIGLHNDFLKAKKAMEESRKSKMDQMGVSTADFTPAQLGKPE